MNNINHSDNSSSNESNRPHKVDNIEGISGDTFKNKQKSKRKVKTSKVSTEKQTNTTQENIYPLLPTPTCPSCGGNCIPLQLQLVCDRCVTIYGVQTDMFNEIKFSPENNVHISKYMKNLLEKNKALELFEKSNKKIDKAQEDNVDTFTVSFQGEILEILKSIKKEYELGSLMNVVRFVNEGFLFFLKETRKLSGKSIYVIDEHNNRSLVDLKKQIFAKVSTSEQRDNDKIEVEKFIDDMEVLFAVEDLKKKDSSGFKGNNQNNVDDKPTV